MRVVYFIENKEILLCKVLETVPKVDEEIKLKGRKGKVVEVKESENKSEVFVQLEKKVKKQLPILDKKKKR